MRTELHYGTRLLPLDLSGISATVLRPAYVPGLEDEGEAFREAARNPVDRPPMRECIRTGERVAVVIPDITRALPNERLLNWLFRELEHVRREDVTIISGTGSHRGNTEEEWIRMVGREIYSRYACVNHESDNPDTLAKAGVSKFGYEVTFNRRYVEADRRILMGFIEPHFMAGFSGGYKAVFPGVAGLGTIMRYHSAENIGHPRSTWGVLEGNPTQEHVRAGGSLLPVDYLVNVTLNSGGAITGFFVGDPVSAHERGCAICRSTAMAACPSAFPIVVTTNSGYPLDQNLYQSVKGLSAASQIVGDGGLILAAARCNDGFPEHGLFREFLFTHDSPQAMLEAIHSPGFSRMDQWQVQILAQILLKARVGLHSELPEAEVRKAHMEPVADLRGAIDAELDRIGRDAPVAILPEGPLTIPYVVEK